MPDITTLEQALDFHAEPIKKSRFIGSVAPVSSPDSALAHVAAVRAMFGDARHHCWAYRLADGQVRSADDGEPGGSAGRPILAQIEGHGLHDVCVVVTRYFGGVKLGVGGLIRAYGGTAGQALDRAVFRVVPTTVELCVNHAYDDTGAVQNVISARNIEVTGTEWGETVLRRLRVAVDEVAGLRQALRDATAGRVQADPA